MNLRIIPALVGVITVFVLAGQAQAAEELTVDPVHSSIVFRIEHMSAAPVFGRFNQKSGTIMLDSQDPANSKVSFTVDPASVDTGNEQRNEHLRSPDFFSAKEFPVMKFESSSVSKVDDSTWRVKGMLEMHGVEREITFTANHKVGEGMKGEPIHGFYTEFVVNRANFNIGPGFDNDALSHEVMVYISLEAK